MNEETKTQLEATFKGVVEKVIAENFKGLADPIIEEKLKTMLKQLNVEKVFNARDRSGISYEAKMAFAEKIKALSEGTTTAGGYLVPQEVQAGIARIVEDFGLVRKLSSHFPMGANTNTLNLPRLTTSVSVTWPGENTSGTASDMVLGNVALVAKTAVGLSVVSNELLADANIGVTDYLIVLFAEALAGEEDLQGLNGTGAPFTGILNDTNVTVFTPLAGNSTFALCTSADNLRDMISQVKPTALAGSCFIMYRSVFAIAQKQKDTAGNYIVTSPTPVIYDQSGAHGGAQPLAAAVPAGYIWGYPVYLSEKMPSSTAISTKYIIFGNLRNLFFADKQEMTVSVSDAATIGGVNAFAANQSVIRVTERVAVAVGLPTAFVVLKTSAT